ncbi:MAG: tetratricopeptide repeat protein [Candidatus Omnitrophota bacterium]
MKKVFLLLFISTFLSAFSAQGQDWIKLHQAADALTINEALNLVRENPGSADLIYQLGLVYLSQHKDKEAEATFEQLLNSSSLVVLAEWGLSEVYRRQKKTAASEKILTKSIKDNIDFSPAYITYAYLKYTQADFKAAINLSLKVIRQGQANVDLSNYARAFLIYAGSKGMIASRGGPLSKLINGTQVLPNLKRAEKLKPDSAEVLFGLGNFYFLAPAIAGGNLDKALTYLERTIEVDPLLADAYVRLAQLYKLRQNNRKYEFYLNLAKNIDSENELLKDELSRECKFNCQTVEE